MAKQAKSTPPAATHLTASLRVVSSYLHTRRVSIETARDQVLEAVRQVKAGDATPEIETLVARLEKVTGVGITELAKAAEAWREV